MPTSSAGTSAVAASDAALLSDYITALLTTGNQNINRSIFAYLENIDPVRFRTLTARLARVRAFKPKGPKAAELEGKRAALVGKVFEKLLECLMMQSKVLCVGSRVRSTTSEIDHLLTLTPLSILVPAVSQAGTHIVAEAKCYSKPMKSEWISEMKGVLDLHNTKVGILFVARAQKIQVAIRTAIAVFSGQGYRIVPFGPKQLQEIESGKTFLEVFSAQSVAVSIHSTKLAV